MIGETRTRDTLTTLVGVDMVMTAVVNQGVNVIGLTDQERESFPQGFLQLTITTGV